MYDHHHPIKKGQALLEEVYFYTIKLKQIEVALLTEKINPQLLKDKS